MKSFFPFVAHVSDTPPPLWRDENSTEPARNIGFLKYNSHVLLCAGFLLLLAPAWYLLSCGRGATSNTKPPSPPPPSTPGSDVTTYHNDVARTGGNLSESILTPSNVNSSSFGKLFVIPVDGKVDGEPVYLSHVTVPGKGIHNVVYLVTEHGSVYAVDADTGANLWQVSTLQAGETTSDGHGCSQITPEIGITATPVINRNAGANGTIYVVAMSKASSGTYYQRLHALDVSTGAEEFGGPQNLQASFPGTGDNSSGGRVTFDPGQYAERAGLLLLNGVIYMSWTSHCDIRPYTGWIMGYDENTLAQLTVLNVTPNGEGGSFWMSGTAPAADSGGNIYALVANGTFDTTLTPNGFPNQGDFGNAFLKISTANKQLAVADYFEVSNQASENGSDEDLGSGGALVLPDTQNGSGQPVHLALGAGKDGNIYVVNRDSMGKFDSGSNHIYQELLGALSGGVFSMPAYFNNTIYYGAVGQSIQAFAISNAQLSSVPTSRTGNAFPYPGSTPSISANGANGAILWAAENSSNAVLHAYDARNLANELYNSNQASGGRDQFGTGNKFITPMIANGKVYVGTTNGVGVFGLLH